MKLLCDFESRVIRLTAERRSHILVRPEMVGMTDAIAETLRSPEWVVESSNDL